MKYAIISLNGKQFKVSEGDMLTLDTVKAAEGDVVTVNEVLLLEDNGTVHVGAPFVENASVSFRIAEHGKDKKIQVRRFKAKSRYRRNLGHRQPISTIAVEKIALGGKTKESTAKKATEEKKNKEE